MDTLISKIDIDNIDMEEIKKQAEILKAGETVIFPTETVYGIGHKWIRWKCCKEIIQYKTKTSK